MIIKINDRSLDPPSLPPNLDSPYRIKNIAVLEYPQKLVVGGDFMKMCPFFIGEEQIRFPDGVQHGGVEVKRVIWVLAVGQARIVPLLPQEDVHSVILRKRTAQY